MANNQQSARAARPALQQLLRQLPSLDRLLGSERARGFIDVYGRELAVAGLRTTLDRQRESAMKGELIATEDEALLELVHGWLKETTAPTLTRVINATGIIVHTNLGRAPLSHLALARIAEVAEGYSNLEYDTALGERNSRAIHARQLLTRLTGAESALVVNNNAAAVLLMLTALCRGKEVIISRGQLVEIGGGFRVPEVMAQSGARLVEVGTTNRTHLRDYSEAINEDTAALLVVHHSNYRIVGFTSEPALSDLAELARQHGLPLLYDQGSGAVLDTLQYGLAHEPSVIDGLRSGVDVVAFSGDKLLGGPQAGILCGKETFISRLGRHPLARAVRADKLCLAALTATLVHFLTDCAVDEIPVWQMISMPVGEIENKASDWVAKLSRAGIDCRVMDGESAVGGGSLPGSTLPTKLVALLSSDVERLSALLRTGEPPIVGRISDGRLLLDPRTVLPGQELQLLQAVGEAVEGIRTEQS